MGFVEQALTELENAEEKPDAYAAFENISNAVHLLMRAISEKEACDDKEIDIVFSTCQRAIHRASRRFKYEKPNGLPTSSSFSISSGGQYSSTIVNGMYGSQHSPSSILRNGRKAQLFGKGYAQSEIDSADHNGEMFSSGLTYAALFEDIVGHEHAKRILREACMLPMQLPEQFECKKLKSWNSCLIFGPGGVAKTVLLNAIAIESGWHFMVLSPANLMSRWLGGSERNIKRCFEIAKERQPTILLIDEVEGLMRERKKDEPDHSARFKTQLLQEMSRYAADDKCKIVVIGVTNLPDDIDPNFIRRFEQRLVLSLPNAQERILLFQKYLAIHGYPLPEKDLVSLIKKTRSFTGDQIQRVVKAAYIKQTQIHRHDPTMISITKKLLGQELKCLTPEVSSSIELDFDNLEMQYATVWNTTSNVESAHRKQNGIMRCFQPKNDDSDNEGESLELQTFGTRMDMLAGVKKGISWRENSCYIDCLLMALFYDNSFFAEDIRQSTLVNDAFVDLLLVVVDALCKPPYICESDVVQQIRQCLAPFDRRILSQQMSFEQVVDIFFGKGLRCTRFLRYNTSTGVTKSYVHYLLDDYEKMQNPDYSNNLQSFFEKSLRFQNLTLACRPLKMVILKIPMSLQGTIQLRQKCVIPPLVLTINNSCTMRLSSLICFEDHHYTLYQRIFGEKNTWIFYNSFALSLQGTAMSRVTELPYLEHKLMMEQEDNDVEHFQKILKTLSVAFYIY